MEYEIVSSELHIENNLPFRIESSRILANFKLSQSFVLMELTKTVTHQFSTTAKELVLAKYDTWFSFLVELEHIMVMTSTSKNTKKIFDHIIIKYNNFLRDDEVTFIGFLKGRAVPSPHDIKKLIKILALVKQRIYIKLIKKNKVFDQEFVDLWLEVHRYLLESILEKIMETKYEQTEYFREIGEHLANIMHHTLYEVYEIDLVFDKTVPYIVLNCDNVVENIYRMLGVNIVAERLAIYLQKIKELNYKVDVAHLKIYDQSNLELLRETENLVAEHNLKLIKG